MSDITDFDAWMAAVRRGDSVSTTQLWEAYFERISRSVAGRLTSQGRRFEDQEDVAVSALRTFMRRASAGNFQDLDDADQLWKLLLTIAIRKANDYRKRSMAARRGGRDKILGQDGSGDDGLPAAIDMAAGDAAERPDAELRATEFFEIVMDKMPDDATRDVVLLHLQGADTPTIAAMQNCSERTVQRRMKAAIGLWTQELADRE